MAINKQEILEKLEAQTAIWIVLGMAAVILYPVIFFGWGFISEMHLILPLGLIAIAGTMVWWFWTMKIIFTILRLQKDEAISFGEIMHEIKQIRKELQKEIREQNNK